MPNNSPSIVLTPSESSISIMYAGFDTSVDFLTVERREAGSASWSVVATPSDGDGEVVDSEVAAGVTYEYRVRVGDDAAEATAVIEQPKQRKPRAKAEPKAEAPKAEAPKPQMQPIFFDPWGLLGDISESDPYAVIVVPRQGK